MEAQLRELLPFLRDRNPQVRQLALEHLVPHSVKDAPHRDIFFSGLRGGVQGKENDILRDLKILCRDQLSVAHDAFRALVNLSDSPLLVASLSDPTFLTFLASYIINPHSILADLAAMLLSNLTASFAACATFLTLKINVIPDSRLSNGIFPVDSRCGSCPEPVPYPKAEPQQVLALPLLIDAFVEGAQIVEGGDLSKRTRKAELHFLASMFANMTVSPAGRKWFLSPQPKGVLKPEEGFEFPLAKLVPFTQHPDLIRRKGVASSIKNSCFYAQAHKAILSPESTLVSVSPATDTAPGIDALPYILLPLAGPEEFDLEDQEKLPEALQFLSSDKKREPDTTTRLTHVETLLLLCHTRWGRDFQRNHGVYEIIRAAHRAEKAETILEHMNRLVQLIQGQEPTDGSADSELEEFDRTPDTQMSGALVKPEQPVPGLPDQKKVEEDEDDMIIEEI